MPPTDPPTYELSNSEKRDLITLSQEGGQLPEQFRFMRFGEERGAGHGWTGKSRDVRAMVLPLQTLDPDTMTLVPVDVG